MPEVSTPPTTPTDSFESMVREHQAGLRSYIRALGAQDAWVDDLAQEVFLVAYRRQGDFEPGADSGRWLRGIARNLVLNERRKNARRSRLLQESLVDVMDSEAAAGAERAIPAAQILHTLSECVNALPPRSRQLLERRYAENADSEALGRVFQLSAAAVRQTLMRTRQAVRRCIERKLGETWQ